MKRNIQLLKLVLPLNYTWFWSGIWLIYYLRFTDYSGIGLIYGIMVPLGLLLEIPTGAISDLLGKKKTLILAFLFNALASLFIGISQSFNQLLASVLFSVIAGALYSGTAEAFLYDSLLSLNKENEFAKRFATIETISLLVAAIASAIGGILYMENIMYPWFVRSLFLFIGLLLCLFLKEPQIDSERFSLKGFLIQSKQGFIQIFQKAKNKYIIIYYLLILGFVYIITEELESAFAIQIGYSANLQGILFAILPLISALGYYFYSIFKEKIHPKYIIVIASVIIIVSGLISPLLSFYSGTIFLLLRHFSIPFIKIYSADTLNHQIESKYRATALSTFTLFITLPYALTPMLVGQLIDRFSASYVNFFIGLIFFILIIGLGLSKLLRKQVI